MKFTIPSWLQKTQWRLLCNAIPECLALLTALRDLEDEEVHQTEAREIEKLWTAAGKGVDEWERKRAMVPTVGSVRGGRPTAGSHRPVPVPRSEGGGGLGISDAAFLLLTLAYDGIVIHVDKATDYHFYPFSAAEGQGKRDQLLDDLQMKAGFVRYTGQKVWEKGLPLLAQVYVYGHCEPGVPKMANDTETKILDGSQLALRLIASGMQKEFSGRVKIFACHSGVANHDDAADEESMAEGLANAMRGRGYRSCEYFGYTEALRYSNSIEAATGHKYAFTATNPSYATSLRNPTYYEEVVKKTLWKVYVQQAATSRMNKYDVMLQEMTIRDALDQERDDVSRKWYGAHEQRASEVRVKV
jgi:hypothetical protein